MDCLDPRGSTVRIRADRRSMGVDLECHRSDNERSCHGKDGGCISICGFQAARHGGSTSHCPIANIPFSFLSGFTCKNIIYTLDFFLTVSLA